MSLIFPKHILNTSGAQNCASGKNRTNEQRPWKLAILWLALLTPFFFVTYLGTLEIISWRADVPVILFDWERYIPFLAWTIIPYWSIDLLYGLSLFLYTNRSGLMTHAKRLLSAQIIATVIFLLFPLRLTSVIPADTGIFAPFYSALADVISKPFNMAPSLHIALLVILWVSYAKHVPKKWHWLLHSWAILIGISVLTAFQHHFFDVPTGALLGIFCLWLWPDNGKSPLAHIAWTKNPQRTRLGLIYFAGAALFAALAIWIGNFALWLLWPAVSLFIVALAYSFLGTAAFQKDETGKMSLAAKLLLAPYLVGAKINSRLWTRKLSKRVWLAPNLWLGRFPDNAPKAHVIDLSAELPRRASLSWQSFPQLDLVTPEATLLVKAAQAIDKSVKACSSDHYVLVVCALGFSRSAAAMVTYLTMKNENHDFQQALALLRKARPEIVLSEAAKTAICEAVILLEDQRGEITS